MTVTPAGQRRHSVKIQSRGGSRNSKGEVAPSWSTVATRQMSVRPLRGQELFDAQQHFGEVDTEFRALYDSTVIGATPKHRLVMANSTGRTFDIESVINVDERDREVLFMAKESV